MTRIRYKAFVSDGAYRRELYDGTGGGKAIDLAIASAETLILFKLSGRVYVEEHEGTVLKSLPYDIYYAQGIRQKT